MPQQIKRLDGKLMSTQDVAQLLGISPAWVRKLAIDGAIPSARTVGGNRIFLESDVERYASKRGKSAESSGKIGIEVQRLTGGR